MKKIISINNVDIFILFFFQKENENINDENLKYVNNPKEKT